MYQRKRPDHGFELTTIRAQLPYTLTRIIGACEVCGVEYFRTKKSIVDRPEPLPPGVLFLPNRFPNW